MSTKMRKKTAVDIARLVNSIVGWRVLVEMRVHRGEDCQAAMRRHDAEVEQLTTLLGVLPVPKFY